MDVHVVNFTCTIHMIDQIILCDFRPKLAGIVSLNLLICLFLLPIPCHPWVACWHNFRILSITLMYKILIEVTEGYTILAAASK